MCACASEATGPQGGKSVDYWARYNDLVRLSQVLWRARSDPAYRNDDAAWKELTDGYTALVDECTRLRFWLEFCLSADEAELNQWRNGDFAASIVNGTRRI